MPSIDQVDVGIIERENVVNPWIRKEKDCRNETDQDKGKGKRVIGSVHLK
jgi:hypothetical protein